MGGAEAADLDGDGYDGAVDDCDDSDAEVHPGADEHCNGLDDDCDGWIASDEFEDSDGDGALACEDCDDFDEAMSPFFGSWEDCDGLDNNCDGSLASFEIDADGDGWWECEGDCDDGDANVHPEATELCNGIDDDCDGQLPAAEAIDIDMDGYPSCNDCNDLVAATHPFAMEVCDGFDNDCDGFWPLGEITDADGDMALLCMDCDDFDIDMSPWYGAWELCDGKDNNCDGFTTFEHDVDGDGRMECEGDCDDEDAEVYGLHTTDAALGAHAEWCDGKDNDCDERVDDFWSFDTESPVPGDPSYQVDANDTGFVDLKSNGAADAMSAQNPDLSHRGWGVLELIHQDDTEQGAQEGPSGAVFLRFPQSGLGGRPSGYKFSDSYCVDFDFRVTTDFSNQSTEPPENWSTSEPASDSITGDGFAVAFFDEAIIGVGGVNDADWSTKGSYGGGYLGAVAFDDTPSTEPGWIVEFDMWSNMPNIATNDPSPWVAHTALSYIGADNRLHNRGRFSPSIVNSSGLPGTTDLAAPAGAVATADFKNYDAASWDRSLRDSGWQRAIVGWNPQRCPSSVSSADCAELNHFVDAEVALWLEEEGEFTMLDQPLVPPIDAIEASDYDGLWHDKDMIIGLTAGKTVAQSTYEIDNLHLVCAPCPRYADASDLPAPGPEWFEPTKQGPTEPPE